MLLQFYTILYEKSVCAYVMAWRYGYALDFYTFFFSLEKKSILISYQSRSIDCPSVRFLVNVSPPKPLEVATSNFVAE